ncbi:MAG TPA: dihydrodipicolinate synthase family protein [Blastocatellia bacterium]|nr:dihydrodipicolinate synthase family protein [Blastocatellia bacterium]
MDPIPQYADIDQAGVADRHKLVSSRYLPRRGLSIPVITVLDSSGRIIEEQQRRVFRFAAQDGFGADIIFGVGTNGEWNRLANSERQQLIWIEADEVRRINDRLINERLGRPAAQPIEAWVGVTGSTREETLANLDVAIDAGADAAVIAPLSIKDMGDIIAFFQREVNDLFDHKRAWLPLFLYDNADIAADPRIPHIRTRDVKRLSRLPFIFGVKVSAPRRVLGNYTKGALHYKDKGEFGIYVGNAMLMFQVFRMDDGLLGRIREYWNRYLLHNELPIGVVSGPANALPREWQRAWRACFSGDERLMAIYKSIFEEFSAACRFSEGGKEVKKSVACFKQALKIEGVIESAAVAKGTRQLTDDQRRAFQINYEKIKQKLLELTDPLWVSRPDQ